MRQRFLAAFLCSLAVLCAPARATDRWIYYPQQTPTSVSLNQQIRNDRDALGTWIMAELGLTSSGQSTYWNLTASPSTGLYVTVAPTISNTLGVVVQVIQSDTQSLPAACPSAINCGTVLAPDSNLIAGTAFQNGATNPIGPLTPPGTAGQAVYYLVETQLNPSAPDINSQAMNFLVANGPNPIYVPNSYNVAVTRRDQLSWQLKEGTASTADCNTVFPAEPSADSGWQAVAFVCVPNGATSITGSWIAPATPFPGFSQGGTITAVHGSGNISAITSGGTATVSEINSPVWTGTPTIDSGTYTGTLDFGADSAGSLARTGVNTFAISSPSNPTLSLAGGFVSGSSTYGPTSAIVNGSVSANSYAAGSSTIGTSSGTINGPLTASELLAAGTNVTGGFLADGSLGASTSAVIRFGNSSSGSAYTSIGNGSASAGGVTASLVGFGNTGTSEVAFDTSGDAGFNGAVEAASAKIATGVAVDGNSVPPYGLKGGESTEPFTFACGAGSAATSCFFFDNPVCSGSNEDIGQFANNGTLNAYIGCDGDYTAVLPGSNQYAEVGGTSGGSFYSTEGNIETLDGPIIAAGGAGVPVSTTNGEIYSSISSTTGGINFGLPAPSGHQCTILWSNPTLTAGCAFAAANIDQQATNDFSGSCTNSSSTTCTATLNNSYSSTPNCFALDQSSTNTVNATCSVSSTTVTISTAPTVIHGSCTMSAATSCTITAPYAFASGSVCHAQASVAITTVGVTCSISSTTITVTASPSNSDTWNVILAGTPSASGHTFSYLVIGNPN